MQKEVVTFYGLEGLVRTVSTGQIDLFRGLSSFLKAQGKIQYKLTRAAYTSKVLVGLLKEEYEVRTFTVGSMIGTGMGAYPQLWNSKL